LSSLRLLVAALGLLSLAGAAVAAVFGAPTPILVAAAAIGLLLTVGALFERVRYKTLMQKAPGRGWVATPERFVDPASGRMVEVHVKPETGERLYVDIGPAPPPAGAEPL
jgi:hypothetical protein